MKFLQASLLIVLSAMVIACGSDKGDLGTDENGTDDSRNQQNEVSDLDPDAELEFDGGLEIGSGVLTYCDETPSSTSTAILETDLSDLAGEDGEFYLAPYESALVTNQVSSYTNFYLDEGSTLTISESLISSEAIVIHSLGDCTVLGTIDLIGFNGQFKLSCASVSFEEESRILIEGEQTIIGINDSLGIEMVRAGTQFDSSGSCFVDSDSSNISNRPMISIDSNIEMGELIIAE